MSSTGNATALALFAAAALRRPRVCPPSQVPGGSFALREEDVSTN